MKIKQTMKKILLILIGAFSVINLQAQDSTRKITLQEAIDLTFKNSKLLKLNEQRILAATAGIREANERKLPDASVSGSYLYLPFKPNIDLKTGENGSGSTSSTSVHQVVYGMASVSVPLYTGGKLNYGIESAKLLEEAVKLDAEQDKQGVIMNVTNACINLYKAYTAIQLVKENLQTSQQRVKDLTSLEKNGLLARNDLLKSELQTSNIELTLLDAESNYRLASVNMNILMGTPEQQLLIPDKSGLALPAEIKTLDEYEQIALQSRSDVAANTIRKKSADIAIKNARSDYYPTIAATGGYVAADIPKFLTVYNAVNVGIGVKYTLSSLWKTKTKIEQAKIQAAEVQGNQDILSDNIRMQVNQAYQTYLVSVKKIDVYNKAVDQATENYRITKNKFDNSLSTTTELLDADVALLQAKLSVTNAQADSFLAYNRLLQSAGLLTNK